jgi:hypothetical protein
MKPFVNIDSLTEKREVTDGAGFNATLFPIGYAHRRESVGDVSLEVLC